MPAPAQQLTPGELAALEQAFAADPTSEAYRPLSEAYLAMGRFMEAMVVCKKGIKSHPQDATPRVLLARIYAAQGKNGKALEELTQALQLDPGHLAAHRAAGLLHVQAGDRAAASEHLRRVWERTPEDPEVLDAMRRSGLMFIATPPGVAAAPGASVQVPASPAPGRAAEPTAGAGAPASASVPADAGVLAGAVAPQRSSASTPTPTSASGSASGSTSARSADYAEELASRYATQELPLPVQRRTRGTLVATLVLGVALAVVLAGWGIVSSMRKARAVEIDRLLRQSRELIEKDAFASYREAAKLCERILERDPDSLGGHAYLAYIDAIRWGEHGESEAVREDATKHLAAVKKLGRSHSHAYGAQAYLRARGGDVPGAVAELRQVLAGPEGASALLRGELGILLMEAGDLDGARDALTTARQTAPGDVRITQMLGEQWRRRGPGFEIQAAALYDAVLTRLAPDHVPSLLGKAQLLLDGGQPAEALKRASRVLELGPGASPRQAALAHALRGSILHALGKASEGDAEEQQALALDAASADVQDLLGRRRVRAGDVSGAVEAFQKAIQLEPARLGFYVDLAGALMRRPGGAREAVTALERASDRAGNARVTKLLGDAYRSAGDLDRARAAYEKAAGMEKRYPEVRLALAALHRDRKEYPQAVEQLERAVKDYGDTSPGAGQAWVEIAEVEEARGARPEQVAKAYVSALKADPQSCPALYWLGRTRSVRRSRDYDPASARQLLSDYVRVCPRGARVAEAQRIVAALR